MTSSLPPDTLLDPEEFEPAAETPSATGSPWRRHWYPVAHLHDLDPLRPTPFTLLGQDLVLWWDRQAEQWRAFADVCPHRLVPLSEGRLNEAGELECPYHGWTFQGDGHCSAIPQAPADGNDSRLRSPRSRCRSFATAAAQGLLFVFAGIPQEAGSVALPLVDPLVEKGNGWADGWVVQDTFRDLPMDALTVLENVLDVSHVPFTHHATVGRRENAGPVELEVTDFGADGFSGQWLEGPRRGKLGSQFTRFAAPALMWHDLSAKGFARILTVVYVTPTRPGECRLFARFPFRFESPWPARLLGLRPRWLQHIGNHKVLEDDQLFLHWQERVLAGRGGSAELTRSCYLATASDRYVQTLHDWVLQYGGVPFPNQSLPERLDRKRLMDRYHSHTEHCRACSGALAGIRRWRPLVLALPWLALALLAMRPTAAVLAVALLLAVAGAALGRQLARWERQLHQGDGLAPRNRR